MSSPRDRDSFDDRPDDGRGWQEPAHLGDGSPDDVEPNVADRRKQPRDSDPTASDAWQPPGWDLPPAEPARAERPAPDALAGPGTEPQPPAGGGLFGGPRRVREPGEVEKVFAYQGDLVGAQAWAVQHGWTVSDGTAPGDAPLAELVATAPMMRLGKDSRPAGVMRGRAGALELVAFDVVYASGRYVVPQYAVTAAPVLGSLPTFRLSPARFWKHRTGGLVQLPSGNDAFDLRWVLLAGEDSPQLRRLVQDPAVQGLLLGTDDGDEFWSAAGHVAAVRPDGHRPELLEHHARLLAAIVAALGAADLPADDQPG